MSLKNLMKFCLKKVNSEILEDIHLDFELLDNSFEQYSAKIAKSHDRKAFEDEFFVSNLRRNLIIFFYFNFLLIEMLLFSKKKIKRY